MSDSSNPLVSIILLAYNQESLIAEAVESLFAQTYSPLEIILSDDASTDNTYAVMKNLVDQYQGIHRVHLNKNKVNLGINEHVNVLLSMTQGELVFCVAGDDVSLPERCSKVVSAWLEHDKSADLIATDAFDMGFDGAILGIKKTDHLENWHSVEDWFKCRPYIFGASHVWSRRLVERFGMLNPEIKCEDQLMTFRAILTGSAITVSEPLIKHRRGGVSQKLECINIYDKQQRIIAGHSHHLKFVRQCINDANILSQQRVVEVGFQKSVELSQMVIALFEAKSNIEKISIVYHAKQVAISKKIRFLIYAAFPQLLTLFFIKRSQNN